MVALEKRTLPAGLGNQRQVISIFGFVNGKCLSSNIQRGFLSNISFMDFPPFPVLEAPCSWTMSTEMMYKVALLFFAAHHPMWLFVNLGEWLVNIGAFLGDSWGNMFILYQSFNLIPLVWNSNEPTMNRPKKNPRFLEKSSDLMRFF